MPPPLPSSPVGFALGCATSPKVVVEIFHDLNCPFSRKTFKTLKEGAEAVITAYAGLPVQFVFQQVIQPVRCAFGACLHRSGQSPTHHTHNHNPQWHPAGCLMHEAALAVRAVEPEDYMAFMAMVYDKQEDFSDAATWNKSRAQVCVCARRSC